MSVTSPSPPGDDLTSFCSEAGEPAGRGTASSNGEPLLEFAPEAIRQVAASATPFAPAYTAAPPGPSTTFQYCRPFAVRWLAASAAALVLGFAGVLAILRFTESAFTTRPDPAVSRDELPTSRFEPASAPQVLTGVLPDAARALPRPPVAGLAPRSPSAAPSESGRPQRTDRPAPSIAARRDTVALNAAPIPAGTVGRTLPGTTLVPAVVPSEAAAIPRRVEERAVRRALRSYETAYETLSVNAATEVWPTVDRQKLARAFATLKSQGLQFDRCAITVLRATATAYCRGRLEYVRKVGKPTPRSVEQQWVFTLRKIAGAWKINDVFPSKAPPLAAPRSRGQDR